MFKGLKNHLFHQPQDNYDKFNQYISSVKNNIIILCNKEYINHQQSIIVERKLDIKNL